MMNHCIQKLRSKGINIAKTKSRHDIFSNLYQVDPELLVIGIQQVQPPQTK